MSLRFRGWISSHRFLLFALLIWALIALHFRLPVPRTHTSKQRQSRQQKVFQYKSKHGIAKSQEICDEKSQLQRVVITVKTGATEAHKRIPIQLQTSLRCAPNLFIFSDMEDDIGNVHIYDALEGIPDSVKENNSDFDLYRKQKVLNDPVKIATILGNMKDPRRPEDLAAWTLDKYKNLHIVEKTWNMKPDMDWYMHIDADTYVSWPTLMLWLEKLDPSQKSFIGSLSFVIENAFAHGGSGILLSREATRDFIDTHNGSVASWNDKIHDNCCGDYVLALALKDLDMNVKNANPTVNGDPPAVIPFSLDRWCQPLVTMHHVAPAEAQMLHEFEARRKDKSKPLTYAELFKDFLSERIPVQLEEWDNRSDDLAIGNMTTVEECRAACKAREDCLQSRFNGSECNLGTKKIMIGEKKQNKDGKQWHSSWNKTRIAEWVSKQDSCHDIKFPFQI